jgi:hypothetical protein
MNIKPLLDLACLKVTFLLHGKSEEEVSLFRGQLLQRGRLPCSFDSALLSFRFVRS